MQLSPELMRAARLSGLPGVTLATACARSGVTKPELERAREQLLTVPKGHWKLMQAWPFHPARR